MPWEGKQNYETGPGAGGCVGRSVQCRVGQDGRKMSFCSWFGGEKYKEHFKNGVYLCSNCGHELFSSRGKYEHSSPWPAFTEPLHEDSLAKYQEGANVYKVRCGKCDNGLGHEFLGDGPREGQSRF